MKSKTDKRRHLADPRQERSGGVNLKLVPTGAEYRKLERRDQRLAFWKVAGGLAIATAALAYGANELVSNDNPPADAKPSVTSDAEPQDGTPAPEASTPPVTVEVQPGDTLEGIADAHTLTEADEQRLEDQLVAVNGGPDIEAGDMVVVRPGSGPDQPTTP